MPTLSLKVKVGIVFLLLVLITINKVWTATLSVDK